MKTNFIDMNPLHQHRLPAFFFAAILSIASFLSSFAEQRVLYDNLPELFSYAEFDDSIYPDAQTERYIAQPFLTDELGYVSRVSLALAGKGAVGTMQVEIWDDNDGHLGKEVATVGEVLLTNLPTNDEGGGLIHLDHSPIKLIPETLYHIVYDFVDPPIGCWANPGAGFNPCADIRNEREGVLILENCTVKADTNDSWVIDNYGRFVIHHFWKVLG